MRTHIVLILSAFLLLTAGCDSGSGRQEALDRTAEATEERREATEPADPTGPVRPGVPSAVMPGDNPSTATAHAPGQHPAPGAAQPGQQHPAPNEAQVLGIAKTLNEGEVAMAQAVVDRLPAGPAKQFAQMMIQHHGQAIEQEEALGRQHQITPAGDHPVARDLQQRAQAMTQELTRADASQLPATYVGGQVTMHEEALRLVEGTLLPAAQRPELRRHLEEMRTTIQQHLTRAREIQPQLAQR